MKRLAIGLVLALTLGACSSVDPKTVAATKAQFHAAASSALGLLTAADQHPEIVEEAKAAVLLLAQQAAPEHAAQVQVALDRVNEGSVDEARALLIPVVHATACPTCELGP